MTQKLSKDILELLERESSKKMISSAKAFFDILEKKIEPVEFYPRLHVCLLDLYNAGHKLEHIELIHSDEKSEFAELEEEQLSATNLSLLADLGDDSFYWEVFDPTYKDENETTQGWLVDDISDIYNDLKNEVFKIEVVGSNEAIEDALWQLHWGFQHHWGNHCIDAMRALHYLWYEGKSAR